jgi:hypothetical protein
MGYLGYKPADKPLTAADITDSIITSAKIVDGTIVNADINASAAIVSTKLSGLSSGLTKIVTTSISGSPTNLDFTNVFSSTYRNYFVIASNINAASNSAQFRMQIGASSSFETSAYKSTTTSDNSGFNGSIFGGSDLSSTTRFIMNETASTAGQQDSNFYMHIYNPNVSGVNSAVQGLCLMMQSDSGYMVCHRFNGIIENTAQFTDFRFHWSTGNFSNTGQITFFGIEN